MLNLKTIICHTIEIYETLIQQKKAEEEYRGDSFEYEIILATEEVDLSE